LILIAAIVAAAGAVLVGAEGVRTAGAALLILVAAIVPATSLVLIDAEGMRSGVAALLIAAAPVVAAVVALTLLVVVIVGAGDAECSKDASGQETAEQTQRLTARHGARQDTGQFVQ
jgi:Mg2+/Co2+ transporter CorB